MRLKEISNEATHKPASLNLHYSRDSYFKNEGTHQTSEHLRIYLTGIVVIKTGRQA